MNRRIAHIDMDAFYASVELLRRPDLKGKPVVIGGPGGATARGVVSTATYEARSYGIHSGMALKTAHRLCPQAIFLPTNFVAYRTASETIREILTGYSELIQPLGLDEAFLDISSDPTPSEVLGSKLKRQVFEATGLTGSVGIAPNKLLAKIGSDLEKPDGLTILSMADVPTRIWPLPVRKLWGVGPRTAEILHTMGIMSIGDLAGQPVERLTSRFGPSHGHYLNRAAHGLDDTELTTDREPKSISRETTFDVDVGDWQTLAAALAEQSRDVVARMQRKGYRCRSVGVKLRLADFSTFTRAVTLHAPSEDEPLIRKAAFACLKRAPLTQKVRLVGMRVAALVPRDQAHNLRAAPLLPGFESFAS